MSTLNFTPRIQAVATRVQAELDAKPLEHSADADAAVWAENARLHELDRPEGFEDDHTWISSESALLSADRMCRRSRMARDMFLIRVRADGRSEYAGCRDPQG